MQIAVPLAGFALANVIRVLYNKKHKIKKAETEEYYVTSPDFACGSIDEAIAKLAAREKTIDRGGEVIVPRLLLLMLEKRYRGGLPVEKLCKKYLSCYLEPNR